jgi:integrase
VKLRKRIDGGEDPTADKRKRREAPTVQDLIDRYIEDHLPGKACFGTWRERDERKMLDQIGDSLGRSAKVADIHFAHIKKLHQQITASGSPVRANRVLALASKAFSLALTPRASEIEPWRTAEQGNPCKGVKRNQEQACERYFNDEEIAAVADALDTADERSSADCIRLIMLTGCRPCEAMKARWSEFDAEPGFWVKPSAHTKQRRVHKAPIGAAARELIEGLRETRKDGDFVFPGKNRGEPVKHLKSGWRTARQRATVLLWANSSKPAVSGLVADLAAQLGRQPSVEEIECTAKLAKITLPPSLGTARVYDLRHTFASFGAANNMSLPIIGKLLGHTQAKTTQRYTHLADAPMREAAEQIGAMIGNAVRAVRERKASTAS